MKNTKITAGIIAALTSASITSVSLGDTLTVGPNLIDYDFITITAAISAGINGDVIEIAPGLYPENLVISDKDLTLRNAGGGTVTVFGQSLDKCLRTSGATTDTVLEGIIFTDGFSATAGGGVSIEGGSHAIISDCYIENSSSTTVGGGLYVSGTAIVTNTTIRNNTTTSNGGGIYLNGSQQSTFIGCTIEQNSAAEGGGLAYAAAGDIADFSGCTFFLNSASSRGGAIAVLGTTLSGTVDLDQCVLEMNHADGAGGAIWISDKDVFRALNSVFANNNAVGIGGAVRNEQVFEAINCTFVGNSVDATGVNDTFESNRPDADTNLLNCIVVNDSSGSHAGAGNYLVTYSLIPEAFDVVPDSNGNFNADPMFTDELMGDYSLMAGSGAIDAGNSQGSLGGVNILNVLTDLAGNVRNLDDPDTTNIGLSTWELCIDLGAYEYQPAAGQSCVADINNDGVLNFFDVSAFLAAFGAGCP